MVDSPWWFIINSVMARVWGMKGVSAEEPLTLISRWCHNQSPSCQLRSICQPTYVSSITHADPHSHVGYMFTRTYKYIQIHGPFGDMVNVLT